MPTIQNLKKKLRGIRSTQKLSKAMKTASTVKYSKINSLYAEYSKYEAQCRDLYETQRGEFNKFFSSPNKNAPIGLVVMASNNGMCGSFNTELLSFAATMIDGADKPYTVFICGKKAQEYFIEKNLKFEKNFNFNDIPQFSEASKLFQCVYGYFKKGIISNIKLIYPEYTNMMKQVPVCRDLIDFNDTGKFDCDNTLFIPDKKTVIENTAQKVVSAFIYKRILETSLGAQAATLMTMRSAYDTATEYVVELEGQINRKRQSQVTADVIETSAEYSQERND